MWRVTEWYFQDYRKDYPVHPGSNELRLHRKARKCDSLNGSCKTIRLLCELLYLEQYLKWIEITNQSIYVNYVFFCNTRYDWTYSYLFTLQFVHDESIVSLPNIEMSSVTKFGDWRQSQDSHTRSLFSCIRRYWRQIFFHLRKYLVYFEVIALLLINSWKI